MDRPESFQEERDEHLDATCSRVLPLATFDICASLLQAVLQLLGDAAEARGLDESPPQPRPHQPFSKRLAYCGWGWGAKGLLQGEAEDLAWFEGP